MRPMKKLLVMALMGLLTPLVLPIEPAKASRMNNEDQAVITHQYGLLKDADKIVIHSHTTSDKIISDPAQIRSIVNFFQQRQFKWRQPWLSNNAPSGTYALEFFMVEAPLVKVGVDSRQMNFRENGRSFECPLSESETQQLNRLVGP